MTQHGWAIASEHGLYIGWWQTRGAAIAGHVRDCSTIEEPETSGFYHGRLTKDQATVWKRRRARGDRTVQVKIIY